MMPGAARSSMTLYEIDGAVFVEVDDALFRIHGRSLEPLSKAVVASDGGAVSWRRSPGCLVVKGRWPHQLWARVETERAMGGSASFVMAKWTGDRWVSSGVDGLVWFDGRLLTHQGSAGWGWHGAPDAALPTLEKIGAIGCENPDIRSATFYGQGAWFAGGIVHDLSCGGGGGMLSYWWREGSLAGAPISVAGEPVTVFGLSFRSPTDIYATARRSDGAYLLVRFDGTIWKEIAGPVPGWVPNVASRPGRLLVLAAATGTSLFDAKPSQLWERRDDGPWTRLALPDDGRPGFWPKRIVTTAEGETWMTAWRSDLPDSASKAELYVE